MKTRLFAAIAATTILASNVAPAATALKTAVFAGGCFWSAEHDIERTPGVTAVVVGYAGGKTQRPSYDNHEGFLESIQVTYDPAKISYAQLVDTFFHHIDPTDPSGQICDQGSSYRTAVFTTDPAEATTAQAVKEQVAKTLNHKVATMILPASRFWMGEAYHQDYSHKHPAAYMAYRVGCGRDGRLKAVWGGHS